MESKSSFLNPYILKHLAIIEIAGNDAQSFLQRQLTSDVSEVTHERAQFSAYLNPKGRVIANFILMMRYQKYYLVITKELAEILTRRLKLYRLRAKVAIDIRPDLVFCSCIGASGMVDSSLPKSVWETELIDESTVLRWPGVDRRHGILTALGQVQGAATSENLCPAEMWWAQDIAAGIPWVVPDTSETMVAQAINLDLLDAINWTKGCYPGQEIVARLHYRGGINRRMFQAYCNARAAPKPGDVITCPDIVGSQTGMVINSLIQKNGQRAEMLVSVPLKFINHKSLLIADQYPLQLESQEPPYPIPELKDQ